MPITFVDNVLMPQARIDLNDALNDLDTAHAGSSPPAATQPWRLWLDTTVPASPVLKVRNAADDGWVVVVAAEPITSLIIAIGDETTAATAGTAKVTFRMPYSFTLTAVRASCTTAPTGSTATIDINENGTSILSTKITIDATEKTSTTAATPAVISDPSLADDAEITIDIDQVGSTVAGAGYKVMLIGRKA